jgi:autotransporter-associated beta strand protein
MKSHRNAFLRNSAAVAIACIASAHAADLTWDAGTTTNWNTIDDNWSTVATWSNSTPDNAFFNTNTGTITLTEAITAGNLTFGLTNANLTGAFAGSALTVNGNLTVQADNNNGPGHLALSLSNNVNVVGDVAINRSVMQITGGTFTANRIGSTNAWGRLLVSGGSVTATNGVDDSILGGGVAMSVFLEGGTLSTSYIKTTSATWTSLGNDGVVLNGGTLRATANSSDFIQVWDPNTWGIRNNVGVGPNGAIIDTNGFDIAINRTLVNYGGAGTLTKNGAGKLTLVWSEHSGGTTVNAGTLEYVANSGYSLLRNGLTVNAGGTVSVLGDGTGLGWQGGSMVTTLNINGGTVTSPGGMHIWNIGGGVNMTGGTLQSNGGVSDANGPQLEWINSTVNTNASASSATIGGRIRMRADGGATGITFNVADGAAASDLLVSAAITEASGGQGIIKNGAGTMTITGVSNYTGGTTINGGVLEVGSVTGATSNIGSQWLALDNTSTLRFTGTGSETSTRDIWINNAAGTRTFDIANAGGSLTLTGGGGEINKDIRKAGAGTLVLDKVVSGTASVTADGGNLTLTGANTYSGGTTVNGGILQAGNGSAFGDFGSTITVNSGGALDINGQNLQSYTNAIVLNGAGIDANTGALFNSGGLQINGIRHISLGSNATIGGNGGRFDLGRDHTGTVNQGNGHVLTKVGSNTVSILNTSTGFSGVVINGGLLTAETDAALGTAPITINGGALGSWGDRTLSNTLTLAGAGGVDVQGGNLTLSGVVDGAGNLSKTGLNILTLTGNNTQTGTLSVNGGHVRFASSTGNATRGNVEMLNPGSFLLMAAPDQFGPNSGLLFNSSGSHNEFALYGNNQTIASLASTNGFAVVQNSHGGFGAASASSTLTVNQSTDTTYSGVFRDSTGSDAFTLALVKEGSGKLTMATNTSHTGGTTVDGGVLEIAGSSGGNGYLRGTATVNAGGELRYTGGDGTGFGFNGGNKIDTLNINGGLINSANTAHLYGVNLNMTGGELRVSAGTIMWNYVTVNTAASASTALINGSITLRADNGFSNSTFNVADGTAATDLQLSGQISELYGAIGLTKNGAGTLELSGTSTYTGTTTVSAGTLLVTGALGATSVSVNGGAFGGTGTVSGALSINNGFFHVVDLWDALTVSGSINLFSGFGVDDLSGINWGSVADGTYTLISGTLSSGVFDTLANNNLETAFDLGGGRSAYFQEGSLQLVVIPEPSTALLGGLGILGLLRRRRK